jgi:hypothetical protein
MTEHLGLNIFIDTSKAAKKMSLTINLQKTKPMKVKKKGQLIQECLKWITRNLKE